MQRKKKYPELQDRNFIQSAIEDFLKKGGTIKKYSHKKKSPSENIEKEKNVEEEIES